VSDPGLIDAPVGLTRRQAVARGLGGASLAGLGATTAGLGLAASAAAAAGAATGGAATVDADRLHRLVSVELLMHYCYEQILSGPLLHPRARRLLSPLVGHEEAHVRALSARLAALGGRAPSPPRSVRVADHDLARRGVGGRLGQLRGGRDALFLLLAVEQVVVGAYFVALTKLGDPRLITLAAQIMASDAQHEALIGEAIHPGDAQKDVPSGLVQGIQ
jgi:Ferritin-like domain